MSTPAAPTLKPQKPQKPAIDNSNPFASPLRRRPVAGGGLFAFDIESLQRQKGASPVKTPGVGTDAVKKPTKTRTGAPTANIPLKKRDGNESRGERERERERNPRSPSRAQPPQLQAKKDKPRQASSLFPSSSSSIFGPTKTLRRTPPAVSLKDPPTSIRSFGIPRSPNIPSPPPKAAITNGGESSYGEDEKSALVAALLERKRVLEAECNALKRKREELELEQEEEQRKKKLAVSAVGEDTAIPGEGLDALIQSLLTSNDSNLVVPKPPRTVIPTSTSTSTTTTTTATTQTTTFKKPDVIPSSRPLPPPSDPSHPLYRAWCPFTFTSHTITVVPMSTYPATDPPTAITHHILRGHSPHHLLSFRFEFDVAQTIEGDKSTSTIIDLSTTAVSSHAQPELRDVFARARQNRDLLLAMTALAEYVRLATSRAEGWIALSRAYEKIVVGGPQRRRRKLGGKGARKRRLELLPWMGKREMWFRGEGGGELVLNWAIEFEKASGLGRFVVGMEVGVPGSSAGGGGRGRGGKMIGGEVAMVGGLKGEVERVFGDLVKERGVLGGVRALMGVVFGVEGMWEEEEEKEEEEEDNEREMEMEE